MTIQSETLARHGLICDGDDYIYGRACILCGGIFSGVGERCGRCVDAISVSFDAASKKRIDEVMSAELPVIDDGCQAWILAVDRLLKGAAILAAGYIFAEISFAFASGRVAAILNNVR